MSNPKHTPLYNAHQDAGGKLVDFAGWALPINYGSQVEEHQQVRTDSGVFDVSHMRITDVSGAQSTQWLEQLLANNIGKLTTVGKGLYSAMLNASGGVIDDLIVYKTAETSYRIVSNAGTSDAVRAHFETTSQDFELSLTPKDSLAMLAVQGPKALERLSQARPEWASVLENLKRFHIEFVGTAALARTGYTGEDGVEIMIEAAEAAALFVDLIQAGIKPIGLGARDTLRLEAGLNLYGQDMDQNVNPLEANLGWTLALDPARDFLGKAAVEKRLADNQDTPHQVLKGLVFNGRGVLRHGMKVVTPHGDGVITSGSFSPTLGVSIAMARVPAATESTAEVEMRGKLVPVQVVNLPFVRSGKATFN